MWDTISERVNVWFFFTTHEQRDVIVFQSKETNTHPQKPTQMAERCLLTVSPNFMHCPLLVVLWIKGQTHQISPVKSQDDWKHAIVTLSSLVLHTCSCAHYVTLAKANSTFLWFKTLISHHLLDSLIRPVNALIEEFLPTPRGKNG